MIRIKRKSNHLIASTPAFEKRRKVRSASAFGCMCHLLIARGFFSTSPLSQKSRNGSRRTAAMPSTSLPVGEYTIRNACLCINITNNAVYISGLITVSAPSPLGNFRDLTGSVCF